MKKTLSIFATAAALLPISSWAETGATCVSVTDSSVGNAAGGAVLVMFAIMAGMFTALGLFVLKLARGAKQAADSAAPHSASPLS